ncbi:MAG: HAMP domain-containing protein [Acidobacteria bacterium]|nr:HAMP domain-containing protein [Acidobacteriota bacterium]
MTIHSKSVRFRLALWYLVVLTAGMAVFGLASWTVLREVLLENRYRGLDQRLDAVAAFLEHEARGNELADIAEEAREYATGLPDGQGIRVRSADGRVVFERKSTSSDTLTRTQTMTVRGQPVEVTLTISLADFHRVLQTLAWVMMAVFPAVLAIAVVGGWWLAKRALQPVGAMTREAREINARDLSARVSVPETGDELEELAEAWNSLLARIEASVQAVRRFTADAAHELRTPVTVIRTSAELALRHPRTSESYRQTIGAIEAETVQMTGLLDQLLLLARGDAGQWKFRLETVFMDQLLRGLRRSVDPLAEKSGVTLDWVVPGLSVIVQADEEALRRVILILIDNALKHTPSGGRVSVRLVQGNGTCEVDVSDNGCGITPEDLPRIFDRFYRADSVRTPGSGAGLGLCIAQSIVENHRGRIEAIPLPQGALFRVTLPVSASLSDETSFISESAAVAPSLAPLGDSTGNGDA